MLKIPTLYSDYRECILDLDIFGKIVATPQQSIQELTETLFEEFKHRKPMPTLETRRYELSKLVNPDFKIAYNKELELRDNESLVELQNNIPSFEALSFEDLTPLIPDVKEVFSYENNITDTIRNEIIAKYDLNTGEEFKPGIKQTENIVGSTVEDTETVLTDEEIEKLGVDDSSEVLDINEEEPKIMPKEEVTYEVDEDSYSDYDADSGGDSINDSEYEEDYDEDEDEEVDTDSYDEDEEVDTDSYDEDDEDEEEEVDTDSYDDEDEEEEVDTDSYDDEDEEGEVDTDSYDDEDDYDDEDEDEEVDTDFYDDEDEEVDIDSYDEDDEDEEVDIDSYDDEDDIASEVDNVSESTEKSNQNSEQKVVDDIDLDDDGFMGFLESHTVKSKEDIKTPITPIQIHNNVTQKEEIDRSSEPTDIRAFLRKHPRCEYEFALKYFTKKQINDAIKIGKIIKKGNILKI